LRAGWRLSEAAHDPAAANICQITEVIMRRALLLTATGLLLACGPLALAQTGPAAKPRPAAKPAPIVVAPGTEAVVETSKGSFTIRLLPEVAPKHAALFVKTAKAGGYDGTTFHRLIAGGIIQGGDPLSKDPAKTSQYGTGGLDLVPAEFSDRPFVRGTVGAARKSAPDSGGKQFFVTMREQPTMKGQYTVFGEVTSGMEVVDQISLLPVNGQTATERIEMKVTIREPQPAAEPAAPPAQ
jgi:cyclophilin family peptidyl-prolyl cis-trans isomerase